ncbi:hypothetical protein K402DRAFT_384428 [Aulographum hederae CBS 113979]|uniref:Nascent polypeptide-associated complex subunit alpha-like UBA domain-containing protein n=1 Tax=Aulographum hederae CBS 113979 TaxID=1176131 RepID=A0A6G1GP83_9PEZI|nr:hypothetical protein K402DRAFT_384428 [Aulographum hederae CBS 113979]
MAEPQPPDVKEGATTDEIAPEARKAAAALSALESHEEASSTPNNNGKKDVNAEALSSAMKNLDVKEGGEGVRKAVVKIAAADVAFIADQFDLSKPRATDMLRANEGNAKKAMSAFVASAAW